tara:strand:+ start:2028 stop:2204 length:177 start_codon:yes stop_codon:yes gene_type:complete
MGRLKKDNKKKKREELLAKKLKIVAPGIAGNDSTLKLLKRLQIDPDDLIKGKYKSYGK